MSISLDRVLMLATRTRRAIITLIRSKDYKKSLYSVISCCLNYSGSLVIVFQLFLAFIIACRTPEVCHIHAAST